MAERHPSVAGTPATPGRAMEEVRDEGALRATTLPLGWDEAVDLEADPATIPDPAEVDVPDELRVEIERLMGLYPDRHSATLPALGAAQAVHGWCSPLAIKQVAAVMQVTPAYLSSVATFYDMLRTERPASRYVYVCTSVACHLRNARRVYEALADEASAQGLDDLDLRQFECLGACDMAPMASVDGRFVGPLTTADAPEVIRQIKDGKTVLPGRGGRARPSQDGAGRRGMARGRGTGAAARRGAATARARAARAVRSRHEPRRRGARPADARRARGIRGGGRRVNETRVLLANIDEPDLHTIDVYERLGGYRSMRKALLDMDPAAVLHELEESGLRGRGGAGFSMGKKASFIPKGAMDKYLCCNADESEPGTFKDRLLMQKNPHLLVEGCVIGSLAAGANRGFIFIRGEYELQADILDAAVAEAYEKGYLGERILDSEHSFELVVHRGKGAYICGEETGLLDALEGKRGNPRLKPPFPANQGLYQGPTLINNVETLCNAPLIIEHGADWFRQWGEGNSTGTKIVSVSGNVQRPGNYEIPLGVPVREIVYGLAGGPPEGRDVKCFFPGGSSAPVLTKEHLDLPYTFEAMAEAGSMLGSGAIIVVDDSEPLVPLAVRLAEFYRHESCGKCVPCREGTNWTVKMLERIDEGEGTPMDLDILDQVQGNIMGNCLCVLGDSMAMPVSSMLKYFREEFEQHMEAARARRDLAELEHLGASELAAVPQAGPA